MPRGIAVEFQYREQRLEDGAAGLPRRAIDPARPLCRRAGLINVALAKRATDIAVALAALVFLLPVFVAVAILIKAETPGPVFFRQRRYGVQRRPFLIFKFRTMTVLEASGAFRQAAANDARVTRIGRFLRRSSLDEAPQLINVLVGDMSLVGPRPHAVAMDDAYAPVVSHYEDRFLVRPGLTGLAQISGYRGPTDTHDKIARRIAHDRAYIRRWSLLLDFAIMLRTPIALVRDPNAL
ncbi:MULTISPECIES: sugar transferase [unclassified Methylobacterium]|uniref:sugar transferase n=1 Tax=unclassified Methylobacterium TaxID=2615210 RepID=UPI000152D2E6|nr:MULTISPECIES: sugar transferase [Methylobacterium]WFT81317.1 sugar transferase [Methylobacterium nodulans]